MFQTSIHVGLTQWMSEKRDAYYLKLQSCWVLRGGDDWSGTATSCEDRVSLKLSCCQPPAEQQAVEAQCELQGEGKKRRSCVMISVFNPFLFMSGIFYCDSLWVTKVPKETETTHCCTTLLWALNLQHPEVLFVTKKSIALLLVVKSKYWDFQKKNNAAH